MALPKVKRENLVEMVFDALRADILSGALAEGERLPPQEELAEKLGVSRTVLREALNRLSSLGLVEAQQGRGTFVRKASPGETMRPLFDALLRDEHTTRELLEARLHLEKIVARLSARRATGEHVARLREIVDTMERRVAAGDAEGFAEGDLAFHLAMAEASGNRILERVLETIREMLYRFLEEFNRIPGAPTRAVAYHKRILSAVERGDAEEAEREMEAHLQDVSRVVREQFRYEVDV
ncbi:MAG: FadR/GntR family transcriptional regulator [Deferrisomatales bacterium]